MKHSAGLLLYRKTKEKLEVLLAHPGGPFWAKKDDGVWTVPKGEYEEGKEDPLSVAKREFEEEIGIKPPESKPVELGDIIQKNNKKVTAWALEGDFDPSKQVSNTFRAMWPPGSGFLKEFPEIDRVEWFDIKTAETKIKGTQIPLLERLVEELS